MVPVEFNDVLLCLSHWHWRLELPIDCTIIARRQGNCLIPTLCQALRSIPGDGGDLWHTRVLAYRIRVRRSCAFEGLFQSGERIADDFTVSRWQQHRHEIRLHHRRKAEGPFGEPGKEIAHQPTRSR